ncbi:MAG: DNA methyltransferase [Bacteroidota bacterium]|nr:DNA methyltransferase [Bacteroidota bacterium]
MAKKPTTPTKVESIRHKDKRTNIPTEELRDFVTEDEVAPKTMLYPRDPSLDPQLVWKGKDEQDQQDLAVPVVPIYIQEKIHPQAIIDALPRIERAEDAPNLFGDFNGGPKDFEQKVEFYQHEQNWTNRMILGDSLLVMTSLAEKEGLKGKVQTIYLDPPYGIKFGSNWQVSTRKRDVKDGSAADVTRQPEQIRAFRDTWKYEIHSYLAYLRDRLVASRELLTETGSVFVQIGDENVHLVRCVLDEVFGSENFVGEIAFTKTGGFGSEYITGVFDVILFYAKNRSTLKYRKLYVAKSDTRSGLSNYGLLLLKDGTTRNLSKEEKEDPSIIPAGSRLFGVHALTSGGGTTLHQPFEFEGTVYNLKPGDNWKASYPVGLNRLVLAQRVASTAKRVGYVRYFDDFPHVEINNLWTDTRGEMDISYVVQTSTKILSVASS